MLPGKQPALTQDFFVEFAFEPVFDQEARIWSVADAEGGDGFLIQSAIGKISAGVCAFWSFQVLLEKSAGALVGIEQDSAQLGFPGFGRAAIGDLGEGNAEPLSDGADSFRKSNVLQLLYEGEHVAGYSAAEAMKELPRRMNGE